jgi:hypothetical protein
MSETPAVSRNQEPAGPSPAAADQARRAVLEVQLKRMIDFDLVSSILLAQIAKPEFDAQRYELAVATERTLTKIESAKRNCCRGRMK